MVSKRLDQLEQVLNEREWLSAGRFTVADLLMAHVLRVEKVRAFGNRPASEAYIARATDRPAFRRAQADQTRCSRLRTHSGAPRCKSWSRLRYRRNASSSRTSGEAAPIRDPS